jgi:hypothetical protein
MPAALLATTIFVAILLATGPLKIGVWGDDGIYLATAESLADGHGYRHVELPGQPYQTKYPILYPLLLSIVWRVWPSFPANVHAVQVINTLLWAVGSWLAYVIMRRAWKLPPLLAGCGTILAFLGTSTLPLLQAAMSEPLYFCLSLAALALALPPRHATDESAAPPTPAPALWRALALGLFAGAAYLTRTIGVTLIVALLIDRCVRRRWKQALLCAVLCGVCLAGWRLWSSQAAAQNAANPAAAALAYDLDYNSWTRASLHKLPRVIYHNTSDLLLSFSLVLDPFLSQTAIDNSLRAGSIAGTTLYFLLFITAAFVIVGAIAVWNRRAVTLHLYLLLYLGLVCAWPMCPWRFLLVILPFLAALLLTGIYACLLSITRLLAKAQRVALQDTDPAPTPASSPSSPLGARISLALVMLLTLAAGFACIRNNAATAVRRAGERLDRANEALANLLRDHTPPDAVICANGGGYLHLRTGRQFIPYMAYDDPIPFRYPDDRRWSMCGRDSTEGQYNARMEFIFDHLLDYLHTAGATYLVIDSSNKSEFEQFRRAEPQHFSELGTSAFYTVYRLIAP